MRRSRRRLHSALLVMPVAEQRGGAELSLRHVVQQPPSGSGMTWSVVFLAQGPMVEDFRRLGTPVSVVDAGRLRNPVRYTRAVLAIARLARDADVVVGWMTKAQIYGGPAAVLARRPAAWCQLGMPSRANWLDRIATGLPAIGIVTNSAASDAAQAAVPPARPRRTVYPAVNLTDFDPGVDHRVPELRRSLGLDPAAPVVGLVGRLQRWKGVHVLLEAMGRVVERHPSATCLIVGGEHDLEPGYLGELRALTSRLGLTERVVFAGLRNDVARCMAAMDVVVHASDREPFGMVILEAMALGKPVVAGAEGGPAEIVADGVDGRLVAYGDVDGLAAAISAYLSDPAAAAAFGARARLRAAEFSAADFGERLGAALRSLAG